MASKKGGKNIENTYTRFAKWKIWRFKLAKSSTKFNELNSSN